MSYIPTNWKTGDLISSSRLNHIENGIAAFYPQTTIIAPEQTVTITAEDTAGVPITLADGYTLPAILPNNWTVVVNGNTLQWEVGVGGGGYTGVVEIDGVYCALRVDAPMSPESAPHLVLRVHDDDAEPATVVPGDYTVKIKKDVPARIPAVAAFPVVAGQDPSTPWVVDAPVDEVDAAMANGCVLLYSAAPSDTIGFAFGILVGHIAYYYATLTKNPFEWSVSTMSIVDGKYAITAAV